MSADLATLLRDAAESGRTPAPVDLAETWTRGRRQRRARRAAPVIAVLAIVGLGATAITTALGGDDLLQPITTTEEGAITGTPGWSVAPAGAQVTVDELPVADPEEFELVGTVTAYQRLWRSHPLDVAADGTVAWIDPERGVLLQHPDDDATTVIGMPTPFLQVRGEWAIHTLQWGPDDRLYLNGQDPESEDWQVGVTQVAVLERDGTLVGVRDNDAGQFDGFVFADGFAWQRQTRLPTMGEMEHRWQAVAEIGGPILQMPDQRASEVVGAVAPDGLSARTTWIDLPQGGGDTGYEVQSGDRLRTWQFSRVSGSATVDAPPREGYRLATLRITDRQGWLGGLFGSEELGAAVAVTDGSGDVYLVRTPVGALDWGDPSAITIGRDGHLYVTEESAPGEATLYRYRHPVPEPR